MAYGRPFGTFKPTDFAYDNFRDKVYDSRYYKTFSYEYISNVPTLANEHILCHGMLQQLHGGILINLPESQQYLLLPHP